MTDGVRLKKREKLTTEETCPKSKLIVPLQNALNSPVLVRLKDTMQVLLTS